MVYVISTIFFLMQIQFGPCLAQDNFLPNSVNNIEKCDGTQNNCKQVTSSYIVQSGDTLSEIIYRHFNNDIFRIYGQGNTLEKILYLNTHITDPHQLRPGIQVDLNIGDFTSPLRKIASAESGSSLTFPEIFKPEGLWEFSPFFSYSRIDGVEKGDGSTAEILSNLNYGLNISYHQYWTQKFRSFLRLGLVNQEFESANNKEVENPNQLKTSLGVGLRYVLSSRILFQVETSLAEKPYIRAIDDNTVNIENIQRPEYAIGTHLSILKIQPFELGLGLEAGLIGTASKNGQSLENNGYFYESRIKINQQFKNFNLKSSLYFRKDKQDTNLIEQETSEIGVGIGFIIPIGED